MGARIASLIRQMTMMIRTMGNFWQQRGVLAFLVKALIVGIGTVELDELVVARRQNES